MIAETTKCDSKERTKPYMDYEYCVRPVHGYRWRCYMRYNQASPYVSLPTAWDKAFISEADAISNCRQYAQALRDEDEFLNRPVKHLGKL